MGLQSHHALDVELLTNVLNTASAFEARAAATRIIADERADIPDAFDLLVAASKDSHPRVRTEAARGLSYYPTLPALGRCWR